MQMIYLLVLINVLGSTLAFYVLRDNEKITNDLEVHRRSKRGIIDGGIRAIWNAVPKELLKRSLSAAFTAFRTIASRIFSRSVRSVAAAEEHVVAPELAHEVGTAERATEEEVIHKAEQEIVQEPLNPVNNQPGSSNDNILISNEAARGIIILLPPFLSTALLQINHNGSVLSARRIVHTDSTRPCQGSRGTMVVCPITACGESGGTMMEDFVEEEISYLNTMLMMQENITSHLKMKQGMEIVPDAPIPTTAYSLNDLDTSAETVVAMELMQINIEDCLCLIRIGGLLQEIVDDKAMLSQITANVNIVTSYYWEAREALDRLKEDFQNALPIIQDADVHSRIEEREELTSHLDSHLARLARDRSNEEFLLENIDKLKKKREKSVLWDLISD